MIAYYKVTTVLKDALLEDSNVNTVSKGILNEIDVVKQTIFPLSHISVENISQEDSVLRFSMSVELLDVEDVSNLQTNDRFRGNDNQDDILNTQLAVGVRLMDRFRRGDLFTSDYTLDAFPNYEKLINEYENGLTGWRLTFDILYKHDMTIC
jgi:hypothetical protein